MMTDSTAVAYRDIIGRCKELFQNKNEDYGSSWRVLRLPSLTDQIMIKAKKVQTLEGKSIDGHSVEMAEELVGIINYAVIALIQIKLKQDARLEVPPEELSQYYDEVIKKVWLLCQEKEKTYQNAWQQMRLSSITDLILMKLVRIKKIEDNDGVTKVSEGIQAGYEDIVNYGVFLMIRIQDLCK